MTIDTTKLKIDAARLEDRFLIEEAYYDINYVIFGLNNNNKRIDEFDEKDFKHRLKYVVIDSLDSEKNKDNKGNNRLTSTIPGKCIVNIIYQHNEPNSAGKITLHQGVDQTIYIYTGDRIDENIRQRALHETFHAFNYWLSKDNHEQKLFDKNDVSDPFIFGGKMFNETFTDIITDFAFKAMMPIRTKETLPVNRVLKEKHSELGTPNSAYSIFTSLTKLMIAAFANDGETNYQKHIDDGKGIFYIKSKAKDGRFVNDFMYFMLTNPWKLEEEYDKYMGKGQFKSLRDKMDKAFDEYLKQPQISLNRMLIREYIQTVSTLLDKRMSDFETNGILDRDQIYEIKTNFKELRNIIKDEYSVFKITSEYMDGLSDALAKDPDGNFSYLHALVKDYADGKLVLERTDSAKQKFHELLNTLVEYATAKNLQPLREWTNLKKAAECKMAADSMKRKVMLVSYDKDGNINGWIPDKQENLVTSDEVKGILNEIESNSNHKYARRVLTDLAEGNRELDTGVENLIKDLLERVKLRPEIKSKLTAKIGLPNLGIGYTGNDGRR